ncbi:MAG: hypothetical protein CV087_16025 [Candidatus Brocadia sp. WS118]|nr:MAG: hypothetical protein CV087_16025 [Candidatus Brocadia sp. WS118]
MSKTDSLEISLEQALALLKDAQHSRDFTWPQLSPGAAEYLNTLQERLKSLQSDEGNGNIFGNIPSLGCNLDKPYLLKNVDFFLILFLDNRTGKDCSRLFEHLNDCFQCAQIFSSTLRDYSRAYQNLVKPRESE